MKSIRVRIGVGLALLISAAGGEAGAKEFVWKLEPGKTYEVVSKQTMVTGVPTPGGEVSITAKMEMVGRWRVLERDSQGNITMEQTIERMKMEMDTPQGKITVDSNDEATLKSPAAQAFGTMIGRVKKIVVTQKMSPLGKILDTQIKSRDGSDVAGLLPGASASNIKEMVSGNVLRFPNKDIAPGATWTDERTMSMQGLGGAMKLEMNYKYVGTEKLEGKDRDRFDAQIKFVPSGDNQQQANVKGKGTMTVYFDAGAGYTDTTKMKYEVTITRTLFGQTTTATMKNEATTTIRPVQSTSGE